MWIIEGKTIEENVIRETKEEVEFNVYQLGLYTKTVILIRLKIVFL